MSFLEMDGESLEATLSSEQFMGINARGKVILEILFSEKAYCRALMEILEVYYKPIKKLFPNVDLETIFINLDEIFDKSVIFVRALDSCVKTKDFGTDQFISKAFIPLYDLLSTYPVYFKSHWKSLVEVSRLLTSNPSFNEFLTRMSGKNVAYENIVSALSFPIKHMLTYNESMKNLAGLTDEAHPDKQNIDVVSKYIEVLSEDVKRVLIHQRTIQKIVQIQDSFVGDSIPNIVGGERVFLKDGVFYKRVGCGQLKVRLFYVFSDCLVYGKSVSPDKYPGKHAYNGKLLEVSNVLTNVKIKETSCLSFEVTSTQKSFTIYAYNFEQKRSWVEALRKLTRDSPIWMDDSDAAYCLVCSSKFTLTNRKHHCRNCGKVVCNSCSTKRMVVLSMGQEPVRVCDRCAENMQSFENIPEEYRNPVSGYTESVFDFPSEDGKRSKIKQKIARTLGRVGGSSSTGNMKKKAEDETSFPFDDE